MNEVMGAELQWHHLQTSNRWVVRSHLFKCMCITIGVVVVGHHLLRVVPGLHLCRPEKHKHDRRQNIYNGSD